jgi:tripartite-type tricarboxylate transporter receptor subunit TctC
MTAVAAAPSVMAQTYPMQPIKILIGFGPGSAADILARLVGKQMEVILGQPIVVENRPGNSSMIAAETVTRASADGYTLFMATIANTLNPAETKSKFNLGKDLAPIALLGIVPNVLVAHPSVPANNLQELIALAKSKPESLTFGSSG